MCKSERRSHSIAIPNLQSLFLQSVRKFFHADRLSTDLVCHQHDAFQSLFETKHCVSSHMLH
ncbi:Uncharacterized protein DAT39_003248 [Clarias magur]|uniref:Uncharacterized protein n=1 Tax=Clarias magur TaxID=1594786 RepID=A0A8J4UI40_CLAMG|nr:Uncharacterized protein DAT39_003248 [Clarias magur]